MTRALEDGALDDAARADLIRGARLFDAGQHFEAHEVWEDRWRVSTDETERLFFQGLIQLAAALHKRRVMGDPVSAERLLAKGLAKLDAGPAQVHGLDVRALCARMRAWDPDAESALPAIGALDAP